MAVHVCPVCEGRGKVPELWKTGIAADKVWGHACVICDACYGKGIIIVPETVNHYPGPALYHLPAYGP